MTTSMDEHCYQLNNLLESVPHQNSYKSISELSRILDKYLKILNYVNSYNEVYKSATRVYYSDITNIRDNIQQLLVADSVQEKDKAFENAKRELKSDLHALVTLIKPAEQLVG